jgi:hypothetical protein
MIGENASGTLAIDGHLDGLLGVASPGTGAPEAVMDTGLVETADILQRMLLRFHPSFRFEERLAARLRAEHGAGPPVIRGRVIPFRAAIHVRAIPVDPLERRSRGLLVGGAIASGVSIASIGAVLAWRRHSAERPA